MSYRYAPEDVVVKNGKTTLAPKAVKAKKPTKYRNVKTTANGIKFDSKLEARRWNELELLELAGDIKELARQVKYLLVPAQRRPDGVPERAVHYVADFTYVTRRGVIVCEDTKSPVSKTADYVIKRKLMLERFGIAIKEVLA